MMRFLTKISLLVFFLISYANAEILKKIEINGNKRISDETIKIFSNLEINQDLSKSDLDKVIKSLYSTNFFSNIGLTYEDQILTINVEENPIIDNFEITGIKNNHW